MHVHVHVHAGVFELLAVEPDEDADVDDDPVLEEGISMYMYSVHYIILKYYHVLYIHD